MFTKHLALRPFLLLATLLFASCSAGSDTTGVNTGNGNGNGDGNGSSSGKYIFAGTAHSIFRSSDSGATWVAMSVGPMTGIRGFASYGNTIFAATYGAILASSDNGVSWTLNDSLPALGIYHYGNYLLAGGWSGMHRSSDGGKTWQTQSNDFGGSAFASNANEIIASGYYSRVGVYYSSDSGASWTERTNGITAEDLVSVAADDKFLFTGSDREGAFRSSDHGQTWSKTDMGTPYVYSMLNINGSIYAGTDRGIFCMANGASFWRYLGSPSEYGQTSLLFNAPYLYCGTGAGVFRSSDTGKTWKQLRTGLTDTVITALGMN
jgi:hypothetical protein